MDETSDQHPIHKAVSSYITDVEGIRFSAGLTSVLLLAINKTVGEKYNSALKLYPEIAGKPGRYEVPADKTGGLNKLEAECIRSQRANEIVPRSLLVALVSQYDAFLSGLVSALFALQPALMKDSSRTIPFSDLLTYSSIDEAKHSVIEAEIESLLRDSHHEQFDWLQNKFGIKTLKKFDTWGEFVELTQRRNLFVHSNGRVSKQYLRALEDCGVPKKELKIGDQLEADGSYVRHSADVLYETAVKLSQVLWRKVLPNDLKEADSSISEITFSLIERKRYGLASSILDFAAECITKYSSPDVKLALIINRANAYRLQGKNDKCKEIIDAEDWRAYDLKFRLAIHILRDERDEAYKCMKQIGSTGSVKKSFYREWPIFEGIKSEQRFKETFKEIFDEEFVEGKILISQDGQDAIEDNSDFSLDVFSELPDYNQT